MLNKKPSFHQRSHKGNALIITISILFLATAQMLFMGLVTSSTTTDEALLLGQNAEVKDALNLGFIDIESRLNMALNAGATPAQLDTDFRLGGACMPSYRRDTTNLATILPSTAATCTHAANTLRGRLAIESVNPTTPTVLAVQPPLDRYSDISVYLVRPHQGTTYTLEARAIGRGVNLTLQKQIQLS